MTEADNRLRVLVVTTEMTAGGAQRFIATLLGGLDRGRFVVELATKTGAASPYRIPGDVATHVIADEPLVVPRTRIDLLPEPPSGVHSEWGWLQTDVDRIVHLVTRTQPDIVLCSPEWMAMFASIACERFPAQTRLVSRFGAPASLAFPVTSEQSVVSGLAREYLRRSDLCVAVSHTIAAELKTEFGVESARVVVTHNPVDIERARTLASEPIEAGVFVEGVPSVIFVGRLSRVKGLEYLLRAIRTLLEKTLVRVVLVGDGPQRGYLEALSKHLGLGDALHFAGAQTNPFRFLSRATVFVLPSLSEGMPNVLLEAMACGCPVIATDIGGGIVREVLEDGECGRIVPAAEAAVLAEAILALIESPEAREQLAARGARRVQDFGLPRVLSAYEALLTEAAAAPLEVPRCEEHPVDVGEARRTVEHEIDGASGLELEAPSGQGVAASMPAALWAGARSGLGLSLGVSRRGAQGLLGALRRMSPVRPVDTFLLRGLDESLRASKQRPRLVVLASMDGSGRLHETIGVLSSYLHSQGFDVFLTSAHGDPAELGIRDCTALSSLADQPTGPLIDSAQVAASIGEAEGDYTSWISVVAGTLAALAADLSADAVLAEGYDCAQIALVAKRFASPELVTAVELHGRIDAIGAWSEGASARKLLSAHLPVADVIIAREDEATELRDVLGISSERIVVAAEWVDVSLANARAERNCINLRRGEADTPVFVCVGKERMDAGIDDLLGAMSIVSRKAHAELVVIAPEPAIGELDRAAGSAGALGSVTWEPGCAIASESLAMATALVYPFATEYEEIPDVVVQAMALGVPVIATTSAPAVNVLQAGGAAGMIVSVGDVEGIAEAMLQLVWDPGVGESLGAAAILSIRARSAEAFAGDVAEAVFSRLRVSEPDGEKP